MRLYDFQALYHDPELYPCPPRPQRHTAEQALSYTWLANIAAPIEHDLCGMRENFDPRTPWRPTIGAARACRGSRKVMARAITEGTRWHSAPTMKMIRKRKRIAVVARNAGTRHRETTTLVPSIAERSCALGLAGGTHGGGGVRENCGVARADLSLE